MTYEPVRVSAMLEAKPEHVDDVLAGLKYLTQESRKEDGCLKYDLHKATGDTNRFFFYEVWASQEHLDRHMKQPHFLDFRKKAAEWLTGPSDVSLWYKVNGD